MAQARATSSSRRPGRPRAGEARLTRERILELALELVDEEGIDALSMRRLGSELGVDPMSLYHHLSGKAAVVAGLVELVFAEMESPPSEGQWDDRVRAWAAAYRRLAVRHPNLVLQIVSDAAAVSTAMLLISEPLYRALSDASLAPVSIVQAAGSVVDYVNGFALAEASHSQTVGQEQTLLARIQAEPGDRLPTLRRVHEAVADNAEQLTFDSGFEAGIGVIVAGIGASAR